MNVLESLRQRNRQIAEDLRDAKPREYLQRMELTIKALKETERGLRSAANLRVEFENALEKNLSSAHDSKPIAKIITDIRSVATGALEAIGRADEVENMIKKFSEVGPGYFTAQSVQAACAIDIKASAPLINSHWGLDLAVSEIEKLEATLRIAVSEALREQPTVTDQPSPTPAVKSSPAPGSRVTKPRS